MRTYIFVNEGKPFMVTLVHLVICFQAKSKDRFFWGVRNPKMWTFWIQKVDFLNRTSLTLLKKIQIQIQK